MNDDNFIKTPSTTTTTTTITTTTITTTIITTTTFITTTTTTTNTSVIIIIITTTTTITINTTTVITTIITTTTTTTTTDIVIVAVVVNSISIFYINYYLDAPRITCKSTTAYIGDRNVRITCDVIASPPVTSWFWILDDNGTTISEGDVIDGYWTIVTVRISPFLYCYG